MPEPFHYEFIQRGLLTALLLGVSGGLLGNFLILRRLSLMGDALSHSLLPGVAAAWLLFGPDTLALFAGALIAGLLTAAGGGLIARVTRVKEDAAFGSLFLILFALGIALASAPGARVDLPRLLFGSVLGVGPEDLRLTAGVTAATVAVLAVFRRHVLLETFDPVFYRSTGGRGAAAHLLLLALVTLNLVAALRAMGVVLSLGLFLLPAATARLWSARLGVVLGLSVALAAAGSVAGILASYYLGVASGAAIVLALGAFFLASLLAAQVPALAGLFRRSKIRHPARGRRAG
ncbi:MAG: metal ABC transporter permease [Opitutaceae bacterium]|jgi:zinc/manganese transport system permease protein|nr:metal ABC transporter permease [Opitutaceae bacterium]